MTEQKSDAGKRSVVKRLVMFLPRLSRFAAGAVVAVCLISLGVAWHGIDKYAEMVKGHWMPNYILIPLCIALIIWAIFLSDD